MEKQKKTKIFLADDHNILRTSLRLYLEQNGYEVVGEAETGAETLQKVPVSMPDLVLLDITFPDMDGIEILYRLIEINKNLKVIALTMHEEEDYLVPFFQQGGAGYVNKSAASEELLKAIEAVQAGRFYTNENGIQVLARKEQIQKGYSAERRQILSARELEVMQWVARGYTCREIAEQLFLSVRTVETYRLRIMHKLGLKNRAELVDYAVSHDIFVSR